MWKKSDASRSTSFFTILKLRGYYIITGKAPNEISACIAGAGLTVLNKPNPGDVHPIAVEDALC